MLRQILSAIEDAGRPLCGADLERDLDIDAGALAGMLDTLVALGRLRNVPSEVAGCPGCPLRGGCFVMRDGVAERYALAPRPTC